MSQQGGPGPAGPTQEGPTARWTASLSPAPCHCQALLAPPGRWHGSLSQSAHPKSPCRTAGCQHRGGTVHSSFTGLPGKHPMGPWLQGQAAAEGKPAPHRSPGLPCCWLQSLLGSARRHGKVRTGTRDKGSATKYRQKTCSSFSCVATGLAGAGDNSRNGSTGAEGTLTEAVSEGSRRERSTSWSRTPVHLPQMAVGDRVAGTAALYVDRSRSSLGRHSGGITSAAGIGSNNHYNALTPCTKTRQVSRVAVMKRVNCPGMKRSAAGSQPHICPQQCSERQERASGP